VDERTVPDDPVADRGLAAPLVEPADDLIGGVKAEITRHPIILPRH
jgi:hypothetical protein